MGGKRAELVGDFIPERKRKEEDENDRKWQKTTTSRCLNSTGGSSGSDYRFKNRAFKQVKVRVYFVAFMGTFLI